MKPDVLHVQWFGAAEADRWLFRPRSPVVFTAHIVPRRTASKTTLWQALFGRCDRVVVHSERGRRALADFGVPEDRLRVVSHPAFRSEIQREDDGRDRARARAHPALQGNRGRGRGRPRGRRSRLLVAGDPRASRAHGPAAGGGRPGRVATRPPVRRRQQRLRRPRSHSFPTAPRSTSGALLQVLGAGLPAIVYDIGGLGEVVGRFGAGAVVEPGDVDAMTLALRRLLDDPDALATARRGAERAREELTWDASAAAHLDLYRELARCCDAAGSATSSSASWTSSPPTSPGSWTRRPSPTPRGPRAPREESRGALRRVSPIVDAIADRLHDVRETYAASL